VPVGGLLRQLLFGAKPAAFEAFGYKFWIIIIICGAIGGIFVYLFLPEVVACWMYPMT
jgi:hypothetical protein